LLHSYLMMRWSIADFHLCFCQSGAGDRHRGLVVSKLLNKCCIDVELCGSVNQGSAPRVADYFKLGTKEVLFRIVA
jgi:hypothetical protein